MIHVPGFVQVMENLDCHEIKEFIFPAWKVMENFSSQLDRLNTADVKAWTM